MTPEDRPLARGIGLPPEQVAAAFPFHFAADESLALVQVGATLGRLCPDLRPDARLDEAFRSVRPQGKITIDWVLAHKDRFFLLEHRGNGLQLRGQFIALQEERLLLFLGSPWFTDASEIAARGLGFDDFAIHDPVVDLLQVFQSSKMALADAKKLAAKLSVQREELRGANERLRRQEREARQLSLIAARTDNAVVLTDAAGLVLWVNDGFTRLTGYTLDEVRGRKPGAVLQGPDTDATTVQRIREGLQQGKGFTAEILNYRKDGREYWAAIEVQPIVDDSGHIEGYMSIESDVTERRAAEQRLAVQFEVASVLAESDDREQALRQILRVMCQRLGWQLGQIWLVSAGRLGLAHKWHPDSTQLSGFAGIGEGLSFASGEGLPGRAMETGEPHWFEDVTREPDFLRAAAAIRAGLRGAAMAPIAVRGKTLGVLEFFSVKRERVDEALLRVFATVALQIGEFIKRTEAQLTVRRDKQLLEGARQRELQTGYDIQRTLLVGDVPALDRGIDIAAYAVPSRGIDGDFYAFTRFRGDCFELLVGDVMGKGVPAALVGAAVRTAYNLVVTELVISNRGSEALPKPAEIVNALHARLTPRLIELETFVTLALYRFDLATGSLSFVNAGHTAGLLRRRDGRIEPVLGHNVPVGAMEDEQYVESTRAVEAGDSLLVYSDGITEARRGDGVNFGEQRLDRLFQDLCGSAAPASVRLQALHKRLLDYVGESGIADDETAVLVDLQGPFAAGGRIGDKVVEEELIELPWDIAGLEPLRRRVAAAGTALQPDAVDRLVLAAFEVATNVVRHVEQPFAEATLSCRLRSEPDRVTVEVWYVGPVFAPPEQRVSDFSGDSEGGFGLYIIENAVSEVTYEQPLPGICCTRLVQESAAPAQV